MQMDGEAARKASVIVAIGAILAFIPVANVLILIAAMLPLWLLADAGIPGLGQPLNGFFVPSAAGWCLVAATAWCLLYGLLRWRHGRRACQRR